MKRLSLSVGAVLCLLGAILLLSPRARAEDAPAAAPETPATPATPDATPVAVPETPATPDAEPVAVPETPPVAVPTVTPAEGASQIKEATAAYNNGVVALKKNDLDAAAIQFEQAAALAPTDVRAQMFLGYVRLKQERFDDALAALEAAQALSQNLNATESAQLQNNLGNVYWKKGRHADALAAFGKAVGGDPEYMDARYNLAFALLAQKNYKDALPHFTALLAKNPPDPSLDIAAVYDARGAVHEKMGQWSKAVGDYRKATDLDKKEATYAFNLALAMLNSGRPNDAIAPLQEVVRRDPKHEQAYLLLGDLYIKRRLWEKAQEALEHYVALRPAEFAGQFNLGVSYDYAGQFAEALRVYAEAERLRPRDPNVRNNVGRIYFKQQNFVEAIAKLQEALQLNPYFHDARHNLALVLTAQGEMEKANKEWKTLIDGLSRAVRNATDKRRRDSLQMRVDAVRGALADNYLKMADYPSAIAEYKQLLLTAPANINARSNLGLALYYTKAYEAAAQEYLEIIKRNPKNAFAYNNLGAVLEAMGKRAEALAKYRQALKLKPDYTEARSNVERLVAGTTVS
ncbi:MAG TPA: tetratricopeptide repeat protein [Abditibacteriaceae bacterium]|nr:tetratricopeptide repeat protein [Abditibacteriaceae bacterium]